MTSTGTVRRLVGASGVTSSCGASGSGRRGIIVQTGVVLRIGNTELSTTAGSNPAIVIRDEEDICPTGDIGSPIKASASVSGIGK